MDFLADAVRQGNNVPTGNIIATAGDPACNYYGVVPTPVNTAIVPFDNLPLNPTLLGLDGSDVRDRRRGDLAADRLRPVVTSLTVNDTTGINPGDTLLITNFTVGHLLFVDAVGPPRDPAVASAQPCVAATLPAGGYPIGTLMIRVMRAKFSVGPDPQTGVQTLWMNPYTETGLFDPTNAGVGKEQPIAENIEDMQIAIGVDTNTDNNITTGGGATPNSGRKRARQPRAARRATARCAWRSPAARRSGSRTATTRRLLRSRIVRSGRPARSAAAC